VPTSSTPHHFSYLRFASILLSFFLSTSYALEAVSNTETDVTALYQQLQTQNFTKSVFLENVPFERDRVRINFGSGMMYFGEPVAGKIRFAVFLGSGSVQASPPEGFEKDNVRRLLKAEEISSDFKTIVLRFTDDSADKLISAGHLQQSSVSDQLKHLSQDLCPRLLKETGMNVSARQIESIINHEDPGIFLAQFDGGRRGRFTYLFDPQSRIPVSSFSINAGEKGLIFAYDENIFANDVWLAFYAKEDYEKGQAPYSDSYNLVDTSHYALSLGLIEPKKALDLSAKIDLVSRTNGLRAIPFSVGESLSIYDDERRKRQLHLLNAHDQDGNALVFLQEPWEGGFTVILAKPINTGERITIAVDLSGDLMRQVESTDSFYPRTTTDWYPRHGALPRCSFDISILHRKKDHVVTVGTVVKDESAPDQKDAVLTQFRMEKPIGLATFAIGPYEIHKDIAKQKDGTQLPLEFYSMPGGRMPIKEDFILAEMNNSVRFFSNTFGQYPYPLFRGVFHPFRFGQGFPTTIMIPAADKSNKRTFSFIAHETSHQWWGDMVLWRSYHDQWLSEGFAEYSGMLYVQLRDKTSGEKDLIRVAREDLKNPPQTLTGIGHGRLTDVGPLIMGHRLETRETRGAYTALTYSKGALVLRMLHFLFTDPTNGNGQPFFDLMTEFVNRYKDGTASTDQFFALANERIQNTPIAQRYGYKDLSWFYRQWVTESYLPSYELNYHIEPNPAGGALLKGELLQKGMPDDDKWFMPIPLVVHMPGGKAGSIMVAALGPQTPVNVKLPAVPEKIELDPDLWVLSDRTSTNKR
jgi:peptidase M1-like protein